MRPWKPALAWLGAVVVAAVLVVGWTRVVLHSASSVGGEQATVISAVSLQVALLNAFFLMVTFGIAVLGFFGFRQVRSELRDVAIEEARRAVGERLEAGGLKPPPERSQEEDQEEART